MKPSKGDKKNFSRRDFLKTTAVGVSAVALTGLNAKETKAQARPAMNWTERRMLWLSGQGRRDFPRPLRQPKPGRPCS